MEKQSFKCSETKKYIKIFWEKNRFPLQFFINISKNQIYYSFRLIHYSVIQTKENLCYSNMANVPFNLWLFLDECEITRPDMTNMTHMSPGVEVRDFKDPPGQSVVVTMLYLKVTVILTPKILIIMYICFLFIFIPSPKKGLWCRWSYDGAKSLYILKIKFNSLTCKWGSRPQLKDTPQEK